MFKQPSQKQQQDALANNHTYLKQIDREIVRLLRVGYRKKDIVHLVVINPDG